MNEEVIDVANTIRAAQEGLRAGDEELTASAESVLSFLVLHLKHRKAPCPPKLRPHVQRLVEHVGRL